MTTAAPPRTVTCFVPYLPSTFLSPNRGERKAGRLPYAISGAKQEYRANTATWLLNECPAVRALKAPFEYARVSIELHWAKRKSDGLYRPADSTNAVYALKAFFDGLIDAGLVINDDHKHMELGNCRVVPGSEREGVLLVVEEVVRGE